LTDPADGDVLVEIQTICTAFQEFRCADLYEFYLVRDRLTATTSLDATGAQSLLDLQSLLRGGYGVALANGLPTAAITSYAQLWRRKLAASSYLADGYGSRPALDAEAAETLTAQSNPGLTFHLHRYSRSFLLDAVATAWALPSNWQYTATEFPESHDRDLVRQKRDQFLHRNPALLAQPRTQPDNVSPPQPVGFERSSQGLSQSDQANLNFSLTEVLVKARKASKPFVRLPRGLKVVLDRDPFFAANPDLFQGDALDIERTVIALRRHPQVPPGPAREFQEVYHLPTRLLAATKAKSSPNTSASGS